MSVYPLVQRGVITITSADTSPKKVTLGSTIKAGSAFVITSVRDKRRRYAVQRGSISVVNPDTPPNAAVITAVVLASSELRNLGIRDDRAGNARGGTLKLASTTSVELDWDGTIAAGETIDAGFEVIEHREEIGATIRLINEAGVDKVEASWDGTLVTDETITISFEVFDLDNFGDDMKEVLFRLQGVLAYLGENLMQDLIQIDNPGNLVSYRMRAFESADKLAAATKDITAGSPLEDGEIRRVDVIQTIVKKKNVRSILEKSLSLVAPTPGVG